MNSRTALADAIKAKLPRKYKVIPAPRDIDPPEAGHPVVMVIRTNVDPAPNRLGSYLSRFAVWVIEPKLIDPEDDLDDALDDVVTAVDSYPFATVTTAERSTYKDQPAWRVEVTTITKRED